jgi:hypothetical protein
MPVTVIAPTATASQRSISHSMISRRLKARLTGFSMCLQASRPPRPPSENHFPSPRTQGWKARLGQNLKLPVRLPRVRARWGLKYPEGFAPRSKGCRITKRAVDVTGIARVHFAASTHMWCGVGSRPKYPGHAVARTINASGCQWVPERTALAAPAPRPSRRAVKLNCVRTGRLFSVLGS